jgi:hypothetical protein
MWRWCVGASARPYRRAVTVLEIRYAADADARIEELYPRVAGR